MDQLTQTKQFVEKYYPLHDNQNFDPTNCNRLVWYCNLSGFFIPDLNPDIDPNNLENHSDSKTIAEQLFDDGYDHYRIYSCGHLVLDSYLILSLYDNFNCRRNSCSTLEKVEALLKKYETCCPCCNDIGNGYRSSCDNDKEKAMYKVSNGFTTGGTIHLGNIIPHKYLKFLTPLFKKGDMVDCEGHRGLGIHIFDGKQFKHLPMDEYWPIIPLEYVKLRGYTFYLSQISSFMLLFEKDVAYTINEGFCPFACDDITLNTDYVPYPDYPPLDDDDTLPTDDELTYPFTDATLIQKCLYSDRQFRVKLSDDETMCLGNRRMSIHGPYGTF